MPDKGQLETVIARFIPSLFLLVVGALIPTRDTCSKTTAAPVGHVHDGPPVAESADQRQPAQIHMAPVPVASGVPPHMETLPEKFSRDGNFVEAEPEGSAFAWANRQINSHAI